MQKWISQPVYIKYNMGLTLDSSHDCKVIFFFETYTLQCVNIIPDYKLLSLDIFLSNVEILTGVCVMIILRNFSNK